MIHRRFADEQGVMWEAITITVPKLPVGDSMALGWTSFRSCTDVRRIAPAQPIADLSVDALRALLARAKSYGPPRTPFHMPFDARGTADGSA